MEAVNGWRKIVAGVLVGVLAWGAFGEDSAVNWSSLSGAVTIPAGETWTATEADMDAVNALTSITVTQGSDETPSAELIFTGETVPTVLLKGKGNVIKRNDYDWTLSTVQYDFAGFFILEGGVTDFNKTSQLGGTSENGGVIVTNGATLLMGNVGADDAVVELAARPLYLSGTGAEGQAGALVTRNKAGGGTFTKFVKLLGDTTICLARESYFYGGANALQLGEYDLTVTGKGMLDVMSGAKITGTGKVIMGSGTVALVYPGGNMGDADSGVLELQGGAEYRFYNDANPQVRPVEVSGAKALLKHVEQFDYPHNNCWGGWRDNYIRQDGPIAFTTEGASLRLDAVSPRCLMTLAGPISGPGSLVLGDVGNLSGRIRLACPTNTFTGTVTVDGKRECTLVLAYSNSIPDYTKLTSSNGRVVAEVTDDASTWPMEKLRQLAYGATWNNAALALDVSRCAGAAHALDVAAWETAAGTDKPLSLGVDGAGTLTLTGPLANGGTLGAYSGTLCFTGATTFAAANLRAAGDGIRQAGRVEIRDGADVAFTNSFWLGYHSDFNLKVDSARKSVTENPVGTLVVSNATLRTIVSAQSRMTADYQGLVAGYKGDGIVEIGEGACVTSRLNGSLSTFHGAIFVDGGQLTSLGTGNTSYGQYARITDTGYGYLGITAGAADLLGYTALTHWGGGNWSDFNSQGILDISGGTVTHRQYSGELKEALGGNGFMTLTESGASWAALRLSGTGKYVGTTTMYLTLGTNGSEGHFILDGEEASAELASCVFNGANNGRSFLDLYAGSVQLTLMWHRAGFTGGAGFVNLNGGEIRMTGWGNDYFGNVTNDTQVGKITVYARGATFNLVNHGNYSHIPIECPHGNGIVSAPIPAAIADKTFIAPPMACIVNGGAGDGATLWVDWDRATGKIKDIRVISPGNDYEETAEVAVRYANEKWTTPAVVGPVPGGALTIKGREDFRLCATNTWSGGTILEAGLTAYCDWAIPSNTVLTLNGGWVNLNNKQARFGGIRGTGGTIKGGTAIVDDVWHYDALDCVTGQVTRVTGTVEFKEGATFEIANVAALNTQDAHNHGHVRTLFEATSIVGAPSFTNLDAAPGWEFVWKDNALRAQYRKGTTIIVR